MYMVDLIGADGVVFDNLNTMDLDYAKDWAAGRGTYYDVFTAKHRRYTVDIWKFDVKEDMYVPFERYLQE